MQIMKYYVHVRLKWKQAIIGFQASHNKQSSNCYLLICTFILQLIN